jgi:hypothetical protein
LSFAFVVNHLIGIVVDILFLRDLFGMIDNNVIFEIEFGHIKFDILGIFHGLFHVGFNFIL